MTTSTTPLPRAIINPADYATGSVKQRVLAVFTQNIGKVVTGTQLASVVGSAENWHQRLSELRVDEGYTILSRRDRLDLSSGEYMMPSTKKRPRAVKRVRPSKATWKAVLEHAGHACEWTEDGQACGLRNGAVDPVGGGTVRLQADHRRPHSVDAAADPKDSAAWAALCGRHQVMKKNFWDSTTGKINLIAVLQAASLADKRAAHAWLSDVLKVSSDSAS